MTPVFEIRSTGTRLSRIVNTMVVDDLATQGAKVSAPMV